jgi:hypothetical protein
VLRRGFLIVFILETGRRLSEVFDKSVNLVLSSRTIEHRVIERRVEALFVKIRPVINVFAQVLDVAFAYSGTRRIPRILPAHQEYSKLSTRNPQIEDWSFAAL